MHIIAVEFKNGKTYDQIRVGLVLAGEYEVIQRQGRFGSRLFFTIIIVHHVRKYLLS